MSSMRNLGVLVALTTSSCIAPPPSGSVASSVPSPASRQPSRIGSNDLVESSVQGMSRVCTYHNGAVGAEPRTHRVGLGQACPPFYPTSDPNIPAPSSARLEASTPEVDARACTYVQGPRRWTLRVPLEDDCPQYAGVAAAVEDDDQ